MNKNKEMSLSVKISVGWKGKIICFWDLLTFRKRNVLKKMSSHLNHYPIYFDNQNSNINSRQTIFKLWSVKQKKTRQKIDVYFAD